MAGVMYFVQECRTCGRRVQIRLEYLGKSVACRHCRAVFPTCDPASDEFPPEDSGLSLLARADQLIADADGSVRGAAASA